MTTDTLQEQAPDPAHLCELILNSYESRWRDLNRNRALIINTALGLRSQERLMLATAVSNAVQKEYLRPGPDPQAIMDEQANLYDLFTTTVSENLLIVRAHQARCDAAQGTVATDPRPIAFILVQTGNHQSQSPCTKPQPENAQRVLDEIIEAFTGMPKTDTDRYHGRAWPDPEFHVIQDHVRKAVQQNRHLSGEPTDVNVNRHSAVRLQFIPLNHSGAHLATITELLPNLRDRTLVPAPGHITFTIFKEQDLLQPPETPLHNRTAVIKGDQQEIENALRNTELKLSWAETTQDGGFARYSDGTTILRAIAALYGRPVAYDWADLSPQEQQTLVTAAAESAHWRQGKLDPVELESLLDLNSALRQKLQESRKSA